MATAVGGAERVVIIGAGHAGGVLAANLRSHDYGGEIVLLGDERHPPYQRPPLSKGWLKGEADADAVTLRADSYYAEAGIDLRLGVQALAIDRATRTVALAGGETLAYDALVLATGSRARRLGVPGEEFDGVFTLRGWDDAEAIKARLKPGVRAVMIGAGYVALEVAASAAHLGAQVRILARGQSLLARSVSPEISAALLQLHQTQGVTVSFGAAPVEIVGRGGVATGVRLRDGDLIPADLIVVGAGGVPNDALATAAGLRCPDGVWVDEDARTEDPTIFAIGDVAFRPLPLQGGHGRIESVHNALEQAKHVCAAITGGAKLVSDVPWFWSDQYETKLLIAGLPGGSDLKVMRGNAALQQFSIFYLKNQRLICVEALNAPADFRVGKQLIHRQCEINLKILTDSTTHIKNLLK